MINGAHLLLYSTDADADRAFIKDVLQFAHVDVGGGWLIFRLPPSELAIHPADEAAESSVSIQAELYLMCDDVEATVTALEAKRVDCAPRVTERWGIRTALTLPSGGHLGLYQPTHPTATTIA